MVPAITELLINLGLAHYLVGITRHCEQPKNSKIKTLGTSKKIAPNFHFTKADIFICNADENPQEMIQELEMEYNVYVSKIISLDDNFKMIEDLGKIFSIEKKVEKLIQKIKIKILNFKEFLKDKPSKRILYMYWKKGFNDWVIIGKNTYVHEMLLLNNFDNMLSANEHSHFSLDVDSFKDIPKGIFIPEIIFLPSYPFLFTLEHKELLKKHIDCTYIFVDGKMFGWYGSRIIKAIDYFMKLHKKIG